MLPLFSIVTITTTSSGIGLKPEGSSEMLVAYNHFRLGKGIPDEVQVMEKESDSLRRMESKDTVTLGGSGMKDGIYTLCIYNIVIYITIEHINRHGDTHTQNIDNPHSDSQRTSNEASCPITSTYCAKVLLA